MLFNIYKNMTLCWTITCIKSPHAAHLYTSLKKHHKTHTNFFLVDPLLIRKRVTVVCLSVHVCLSVCQSNNALTARVLISAIQTWYYQNQYHTLEVFFDWYIDFAKMALFKTYAVIYLAIGTAICEVLFVFYSYPNDDIVMATFDCLILHACLIDSAQYIILWCII